MSPPLANIRLEGKEGSAVIAASDKIIQDRLETNEKDKRSFQKTEDGFVTGTGIMGYISKFVGFFLIINQVVLVFKKSVINDIPTATI